ncbi:protein FAR1-RELATED SEQUENCE 5-like [Apium graveolens]|uniref:protein FAR1-RELATED SEQUENCE 5-like n=1 Tax=Apium graveolens TaxID=4045 RepID=UPI003D7A7296
MAGVIQSQLPNMTHLLCSCHISKKFPEKFSTYYAKDEFKGDFTNCIYHSLTEKVFEDRWQALILKYKLEDNTWLQGLYNLKHKWIDTYTRNIFSVVQKTTSKSEEMNAFFDAYVGSWTGLKEFVEVRLGAPCRFHYTKEIFKRFQDQLVEAAKYFAEKDRDRSLEDVDDMYFKCYRPSMLESKRTTYLVNFNKLSLRGPHICRMFEQSGMSCRHIISVLTKRRVAELSEHFMKRRWTRDANRVDGVFPYHMPGDDAPSHDLTPMKRFSHMTLLTMGFSHSCMASNELYEYAVRVINRETEIIEKMPVDGVECVGSEFDTKITQGSQEKLHETILDPIVLKTKGPKKEH